MLPTRVVPLRRGARPPLWLPGHPRAGRVCTARVHGLTWAARRPVPERGGVSLCGSGYPCHAHRRMPARAGWPVDSTSGTTTTPSAD